jgi:dTMP kinase
MRGRLITFEGTEGVGKSTQIARLVERLWTEGHAARLVREPGGTLIGEEIRHTLKHSPANHAMTAETELLMMNASRAQLVREVIEPALAVGEIVVCDRFYDSTTAYQGYGRGLDLGLVKAVIDFAVGGTRPDLTLLLEVPPETSRARVAARQSEAQLVRDRIEEAGESFFERVAKGYQAIAEAEPKRVKRVDASGSVESVGAEIWKHVTALLASR